MRLKIISGVALALIILYGCASSNKKDTTASGIPAILEPQSLLKFGDVPVPMGFKILTKDTYTFESGGMRVGVLKYQGKADPDQVMVFYKEQMPLFKWELLNSVEYGDRLMNFERNNESCILTISPKQMGGTLITISLGPKAPQASKKAKEPIK
jgi:hypothetical protein